MTRLYHRAIGALDRHLSRLLFVILAVAAVLVAVAACGSSTAGGSSNNVKGVPGTSNVQWVCHGTTILYFFSGTVTALADAPQCKPSAGG